MWCVLCGSDYAQLRRVLREAQNIARFYGDVAKKTTFWDLNWSCDVVCAVR